MPFSDKPYTWQELWTSAPDGYYYSISSLACGRSTLERWVAKEGRRLTQSGYRSYASCAPPEGPTIPPAMSDLRSARLWELNGETGGAWYRWLPPLEWDPAWDSWEPEPPPPNTVRQGWQPCSYGWNQNHPISFVPEYSSLLCALYAAVNVRGRWRDREQTIWREGEACVLYASRVFQCPWPPAEARLLYEVAHAEDDKYLQNLMAYAYFCRRGRWLVAEPYLRAHPGWWRRYRYWVCQE